MERKGKEGGEQEKRMGPYTSSLVFSAITLCMPMPTPSITARRIAQPMAEFRAALNPPRIANEPPVRKPAPTEKDTPISFLYVHLFLFFFIWGKGNKHILAFHGSSFFRNPLTAQSNVENRPPQTPKLPPSTGARALMAVRAPILRSP